MINRFADVRGINEILKFSTEEYLRDDIVTYTFNKNTILNNCCNPGLGIKNLQK